MTFIVSAISLFAAPCLLTAALLCCPTTAHACPPTDTEIDADTDAADSVPASPSELEDLVDAINPTMCTLDDDALVSRLEQLETLMADSLLEPHRARSDEEGGGFLLVFHPSALSQIEQLVALEADCCANLPIHIIPHDDRIEVVVAGAI